MKTLSTQAGDLPLIPEWSLGYTGTPGSGTAVLPCYIVTEDLIEYHWLTDPNPRVFQLGLPGSLASQMVVVKFGARGGEGRVVCALRSESQPVGQSRFSVLSCEMLHACGIRGAHVTMRIEGRDFF